MLKAFSVTAVYMQSIAAQEKAIEKFYMADGFPIVLLTQRWQNTHQNGRMLCLFAHPYAHHGQHKVAKGYHGIDEGYLAELWKVGGEDAPFVDGAAVEELPAHGAGQQR